MAVQKWAKWDLDFWRDEKVKALVALKGEAAVFKWVKLCCLSYRRVTKIPSLAEDGKPDEVSGALDMSDRITRIDVEDEMGIKGKRLDAFIESCIECRLFDRFLWEQFRIVTSRRMKDQGNDMIKIMEQRSAAGKKSAEKRSIRSDENATDVDDK